MSSGSSRSSFASFLRGSREHSLDQRALGEEEDDRHRRDRHQDGQSELRAFDESAPEPGFPGLKASVEEIRYSRPTWTGSLLLSDSMTKGR